MGVAQVMPWAACRRTNVIVLRGKQGSFKGNATAEVGGEAAKREKEGEGERDGSGCGCARMRMW